MAVNSLSTGSLSVSMAALAARSRCSYASALASQRRRREMAAEVAAADALLLAAAWGGRGARGWVGLVGQG